MVKMITYEQMTKKQKDKVDAFARKYVVDILASLKRRLYASLPSPGNGYVIERFGDEGEELAVNDLEFIEKHYKIDPSFWKMIRDLKIESEKYLKEMGACEP